MPPTVRLAFNGRTASPSSMAAVSFRPWVSRRLNIQYCARDRWASSPAPSPESSRRLHRHRRKLLPRCGAAVCSSRRSGSGRKGSLFIKFIQRQIEFNNVDNRLADIFHQRLLAVFCDQLRELFNAEITRFRHAWICQSAACGVILLSSPLAMPSPVQLNAALASGLAARNAATRAAISLSSSGLLTARLLPARSTVDYRHFCRCRRP